MSLSIMKKQINYYFQEKTDVNIEVVSIAWAKRYDFGLVLRSGFLSSF